MGQEQNFACVIDDPVAHDHFSAECSVSRSTRDTAIADIYIAPISNQIFFYGSKETWKKTPGSFPVSTKEKSGSHNHFVLYDLTGHGLYIIRDNRRREVLRRECSIWDLGQVFGQKVMDALKVLK